MSGFFIGGVTHIWVDKTTATLLKGLLPNQELRKKLASVTFHLFSTKTQSSLSPFKPAAPTSCSRSAGSAAEATSVSASDDAKLTSFKLKTLVPLQRKMVSSNKDTKLQDKMLTLQHTWRPWRAFPHSDFSHTPVVADL